MAADDYKFLLNRHTELAERAELNWAAELGPFVNPLSADKLIKHFARSHKHLEPGLFGGHEAAERKRLGFLCAGDYHVSVIKVTFDSSRAPGHRDLLGSLIGLGLDRKVLGDVCLFHDSAYLFCDSSAEGLTLDNLREAGRTPLRTSRASLDEMPPVFSDYTEMSVSLDSLRLDALLSKVFGISRQEAKELTHSGKTFVNWESAANHARAVKPGETVTLRGSGRFTVDDVQEKNGKTLITLRKY